ncbi:MAG: hypothetical protein ACLGHN_05350 [Bacteriovoracia bacterium]
MKKYVFFILFKMLLILSSAYAEVLLSFPDGEVKQGSLEKTVLNVDMKTAQLFNIQKLKGETVEDVLYFHHISPLERKSDDGAFYAEATVIFAKVPESNSLIYKGENGNITISWPEIEVTTTEADQKLIFADFTIPGRKNVWLFVLSALLLLSVGIFTWVFRQRWKTKQLEKKRKQELKEQLFSARSFEDVVFIWQKKHQFLKEFDHLEEPFRHLEQTLFKYQFKPKQSESEKEEVLKAFRSFIQKIEGGFNGV